MQASRLLGTAMATWSLLALSQAALAQGIPARALLEQSAAAMGGLERLRALDNFVMTGFGQNLSQLGGGNLSPHPRAPSKWQAANYVTRSFDLTNGRAVNRDRRGNLFPFAAISGHSFAPNEQLQTGVAMLDHPVPALLAALDSGSRLGAVSVEADTTVVEFSIASGEILWLALDNATRLPAWVRWIGGDAALGDVTYTRYFTGYLPFEGIQLPAGFTTGIDWRDTTIATLHVDSYRLDVDDLGPFPTPRERRSGEPSAIATPIAEHVWDVRYGVQDSAALESMNGSMVVEFDDHLTMFEAYGSEPATLARIDLANTLVPGKEVTEVIVSHHHFDHSGGLRAAVARGLTIISRRGNEPIFREMVARPAVVYPDALGRNPRPLKFVPVDEHLVLEDGTMRVDVYHALGHLHMADAVIAYVPEHRIVAEGDFSVHDWDFHWWGDAYLDTVEHYGLDPAFNIPVHGRVSSFEETIASIEEQAARAREFCDRNEAAGIFMAGCPVRFSRGD